MAFPSGSLILIVFLNYLSVLKNFKVLIGLMFFAMMLLIGFQWYWVESAFAMKNEQFDRKVMESLNETIRKVEKQEVIFLANQKIKASENNRLLTALQPKTRPSVKKISPQQIIKSTADSLRLVHRDPETENTLDFNLSYYENKTILPSDIGGPKLIIFPENRLHFIRNMLYEQQVMWERFNQNAQDIFHKEQTFEEIIHALNEQVGFPQIHQSPVVYNFGNDEVINQRNRASSGFSFKIYRHKDSVRAMPQARPLTSLSSGKDEDIKEALEKKQNKAELVRDVFKDFIRGNRNIYERLNQQMLDTLLRKEFQNNGVDIPFEYGVKNNGNMIFTSYALNLNPQLTSRAYHVRLFPNDALQQDQFLYVYFPKKESFILGDMWTVFGSSFLLILMIGGIFYSSVTTMLNQKKLSNIKNDFINNMTHELKTPISTISLAVEVMKDDHIRKDKTKTDRYLGIIHDENKRLGTQVEKVLQIALLEKGDVKLNIDDVNLHEIIDHVSQNLSVQLEQKGGSIDLILDATEPLLNGDEVHITNIVYNLLDNAIKYSGEAPEITIRTENENHGIKLSVEDKGIGINREQLSRIFEKFYRVPTGNVHDVKGFGLGLSYVRRMAELHGGHVKASSKPGEGSTFEVFLPGSFNDKTTRS